MNDFESQATHAIEEIPARDPSPISMNPIVDALLAKGDIGLLIILGIVAIHYFDLKSVVKGHLENQKTQANALSSLTESVSQFTQQLKEHMQELRQQHILGAQRHSEYLSDHQEIISAVKDVDNKVGVIREDVKELKAEVKELKS